MIQGYPQGQPQQMVQGYPQGQPQQTGYNPGYQHGGDQKPGQVYPLPQAMPQQPSEKTALLQQGIVQYTPDPNQGPPPQYQAIPNMEGAAQCPILFDYTVIPDGNLLFPQNCPPIDKPSTVKCNINGSGNIETYEPALDSDTDELWKFFMSHLSPPKVTIQVNGHHQETRTRTVVRDGQSHMETYQESVQDFNFTFDISPFVSPLWARIACVPIPGQPPKTYKDTLAEYATSKNKLKEIHLEKQANWDYGQISNMIVGCVRATGYPHSIIVTYPTTGNKVHVYASGGVSQLAHNNCVKCLCVVTCLCIIFFPMYYMARKKTSNKIICDYSINLSPMEFYARNYYNIQHHVRRRTFGLVALC
ncbi:hypothetical protein BC833DRAFT_598865 [Globomyces pollinis-pini]|nr:hypothetical protein BC833DRAFT_598865 [Globomyces pollinis-pini]